MTGTKTQVLLLPLMVYAACGLVLSLAAHLSALVGLQPGGTALFVGLHVGIFPLWIPVVFIAMKLTGGMRPTMTSKADYWNAMFSGCPAWMRGTGFARRAVCQPTNNRPSTDGAEQATVTKQGGSSRCLPVCG